MRVLIAIVACAVVTTAAAAGGPAPAPQLPDKFTNLQLLPKEITKDQIAVLMRSFAMGLGTRCEHCHVGQGNDLTRFDFASDAKPEKATARRMMTMLNVILQEGLLNVGKPSPQPKVTCYTCHRGDRTPVIAPPGGRGSVE